MVSKKKRGQAWSRKKAPTNAIQRLFPILFPIYLVPHFPFLSALLFPIQSSDAGMQLGLCRTTTCAAVSVTAEAYGAPAACRDVRIIADRDGRRSSRGVSHPGTTQACGGVAAQRESTRLPTVGGRGGDLVRRRMLMEVSAVLRSRRSMCESRWG